MVASLDLLQDPFVLNELEKAIGNNAVSPVTIEFSLTGINRKCSQTFSESGNLRYGSQEPCCWWLDVWLEIDTFLKQHAMCKCSCPRGTEIRNCS